MVNFSLSSHTPGKRLISKSGEEKCPECNDKPGNKPAKLYTYINEDSYPALAADAKKENVHQKGAHSLRQSFAYFFICTDTKGSCRINIKILRLHSFFLSFTFFINYGKDLKPELTILYILQIYSINNYSAIRFWKWNI